MKIGSEDRKKLITAGVLGFLALLAVGYLYETLFSGPSTPPPQRAAVVTAAPTVKTVGGVNTSVSAPTRIAVGGAAQKVGTASGQLDPTLHMEAMLRTESLVYTGTGRNIFAAGPAEMVAIPKPVAAARPIVIPAVVAQGPVGPPPVPPAPPINLKFFGTATTPGGNRRAFLLNGDDVYLASVGDVVQRRYRVLSIAATSILVEDVPNSNRQTLPLMGN